MAHERQFFEHGSWKIGHPFAGVRVDERRGHQAALLQPAGSESCFKLLRDGGVLGLGNAAAHMPARPCGELAHGPVVPPVADFVRHPGELGGVVGKLLARLAVEKGLQFLEGGAFAVGQGPQAGGDGDLLGRGPDVDAVERGHRREVTGRGQVIPRKTAPAQQVGAGQQGAKQHDRKHGRDQQRKCQLAPGATGPPLPAIQPRPAGKQDQWGQQDDAFLAGVECQRIAKYVNRKGESASWRSDCLATVPEFNSRGKHGHRKHGQQRLGQRPVKDHQRIRVKAQEDECHSGRQRSGGELVQGIGKITTPREP